MSSSYLFGSLSSGYQWPESNKDAVCAGVLASYLMVHPVHGFSILHRHLQSLNTFIISICTTDYNYLKLCPVPCPFFWTNYLIEHYDPFKPSFLDFFGGLLPATSSMSSIPRPWKNSVFPTVSPWAKTPQLASHFLSLVSLTLWYRLFPQAFLPLIP